MILFATVRYVAKVYVNSKLLDNVVVQGGVNQHNILATIILYYRSKGCAFVNACKAGNAEAVERMMRTADFQSVYNGIIAAFDNKQRYYAKWRALLKSILVL